MRIDAHQHFWRLARGDYGWLTPKEHPAIHRDFLPADLLPHLKDARIDKTILVQAAPTQVETQFLLELADATPFVAGVVGWADFDSPDAPRAIEMLAQNRKLVGLRPMLQDLVDDAWLLKPHIAPAIDAMKKSGLRFDALVKPRHLPVLEEFVRSNPELPVVIDHGAKPGIASGDIAGWSRAMRRVSEAQNVVCKISGLVTEAGPNCSNETIRLFADILLEAFGPARLMWGSDWPVLIEASDYATWLDTAQELTTGLSQAGREAIFGGTAAGFYGVAP